LWWFWEAAALNFTGYLVCNGVEYLEGKKQQIVQRQRMPCLLGGR